MPCFDPRGICPLLSHSALCPVTLCVSFATVGGHVVLVCMPPTPYNPHPKCWTLLQVLARMARIGVTPLPQSLTTLLQCFMRLGQVDTAHSVLDWMRRK